MTRKYVKGADKPRPGLKAGEACEGPGCNRKLCSRWLAEGRCCTRRKCQLHFGVGTATLVVAAKAALVVAANTAAPAPAPAVIALPDFAEVALRAVDDGGEAARAQLEAEKEAHLRCRAQVRAMQNRQANSNDVVRRMLLALISRSLTSERERLGVDEACELSGLDFTTLHGRLVVRREHGVRYVQRPTAGTEATLYPRGYFERC